MELHEAFAVLLGEETGPSARAAHDAIRFYALRAARAQNPLSTADVEDCAQDVTFKLWKRLSIGNCPVGELSHAACAAYVRKMAANWMIDRRRRHQTRTHYGDQLRHQIDPQRASNDVEQRAVEAEEERETTQRGAQAWALLDRLALHAIEHRQARHRPHLEEGWREIKAMVLESTTLEQLLEARGEVEPGHEAESRVRARNAAYKRHQRTREALEASLGALARSGVLGAGEVEIARLAISALARCQRSPSEHVDEERS